MLWAADVTRRARDWAEDSGAGLPPKLKRQAQFVKDKIRRDDREGVRNAVTITAIIVLFSILIPVVILAVVLGGKHTGWFRELPEPMSHSKYRSVSTNTDQGHSLSADWPQLNLLFLTKNGFSGRFSIWNEWFRQARYDLNLLGIEPFSGLEDDQLRVAPGADHCQHLDQSALIRGFASVNHAANGNPELPCFVQLYIPANFSATSGQTDEVATISELLSIAVSRGAPSAYYVVLDEYAVPVKPAIEIIHELIADKRSRLPVRSVDPDGAIRLTSRYWSLSNRHAMKMVLSAHDWVNFEPASPITALPGPEYPLVYGPTQIICRHEGRRVPQGAPQGFQLERSCAIQDDYPAVSAEDYPPSAKWIFDDVPADLAEAPVFTWQYDLSRNPSGKFIGGGFPRPQVPMRFTRVHAGLLRYLREKSGVWFAEQFADEAYATHCSISNSPRKYFRDWIGISTTDGRQDDAYEASFFELIGDYPEEAFVTQNGDAPVPTVPHHFLDKDECAVESLVRRLLNLKPVVDHAGAEP